jgi:hypothetical protein
MALQIQVAVEVEPTLLVQQASVVQVLSSSAIQTHSYPHQLSQVFNR